MALLGFPNPVNDKAARVVAAGVLVMALGALVLGQRWLLVPLAYGFVARVLTGPRLSPLGQLATRVVAPRLGPPKPVPGPPKRFAQGMGATITVSALIAEVAGAGTLASVLLVMIVIAASLESGLGLCLGCSVFRGLMRVGLIPESACEACAQLWTRPTPARPAG